MNRFNLGGVPLETSTQIMTNEQNQDRRIICPVCNVEGTATIQYKSGYIVVAHSHKPHFHYMRNDEERAMVMDVVTHWINFESECLPLLIKYGTLEDVKKYIPDRYLWGIQVKAHVAANRQNKDRIINCPVCPDNALGTASIQYRTGYVIVMHTHKPQCYVVNDEQKMKVMQIATHWVNFESKSLPRLIKYGTLEKVKKYFPTDVLDSLDLKLKKVGGEREVKKVLDAKYREGERVEIVKDGKTYLTEIKFDYGRHSNKTERKCPKCGLLGREAKDFHVADKKGYYIVNYQHRVGNLSFIDVNTGKTVKIQAIRTKCKVGKGYTPDMLFKAMSEE